MMNLDYNLYPGSHDHGDPRKCAMEWVAQLAGEPQSDHPKCVDGTIAFVAIRLNDSAPSFEMRQRLRPLLVRTIGTAGDGHASARGAAFKRMERLAPFHVRMAVDHINTWSKWLDFFESLLPELEYIEIPAEQWPIEAGPAKGDPYVEPHHTTNLPTQLITHPSLGGPLLATMFKSKSGFLALSLDDYMTVSA